MGRGERGELGSGKVRYGGVGVGDGGGVIRSRNVWRCWRRRGRGGAIVRYGKAVARGEVVKSDGEGVV